MSSDFEIKLDPTSDTSIKEIELPVLPAPSPSRVVPLVGFISDTTIQTPGIPQKGSITLLDTHLKIPTEVVAKWVSGNFRSGVPVGTVTRFDPNSLEFESSINWNSLNPKLGVFNNTHLGNTPLWAAKQGSISAVLARQLGYLKTSDLTYRSIEHDMFFLTKNKYISESEYSRLMGRTTPRSERFWELQGFCRKSIFKNYVKAIFTTWSVTDDAESLCIGNGFKEGTTRTSSYPVKNPSLYHKTRLINIFEIYSDTPALCLSFIDFIPNPKGVLEGRVFHIWIRPSIEESLRMSKETSISDDTNIYFKDHTSPAPYIFGGLPRLAWKLYVASLGLNQDTSQLSFKTEVGTVNLNMYSQDYTLFADHYFNLMQFFQWGVELYAENSFVLRGFYLRESFGLSMAEGSTIKFADNPALLQIKNFDILQKILRAKIHSPSDFTQLRYQAGRGATSTVITSELLRLGFTNVINNSTNLSTRLKEIVRESKIKSMVKGNPYIEGQSYTDFVRKLTQVEFRSHLKV